MRNLILSISFLLIASSFFSCSKDDDPTPEDMATNDELVIKIGEGLNDLKIGDLASEAFDIYGSNYFTLLSYLNDNQALFYVSYQKLGFQLNLEVAHEDTDEKTLAIIGFTFVEEFAGETEEGIKIGSTLAEVQTVYGEKPLGFFDDIGYSDLGVSFDFDEEELVERISIFEPY